MNKKGYTLLELSIVILIAGVLAAGAVKAISGAISSTRQNASKDSVQTLIKEIGEYSAKAQSIPTTSSDYAVTSGSAVYDATQSHNDAFKKPMLYVPAAELTALNVSGNVSGLCGLNTTSLTVRECADAACTTPVTHSNVAFAAISGGANQNIQTTVTGTLVTVYNSSVSIDGYTSAVSASPDPSTVQSYDDIVGYMTFDMLKKYAGCEGGALGVNQNKLPDAIHKNTYDFDLTPRGGKSPYKWCVMTDQSSILSSQMYYNVKSTTNTSLPLINQSTGCVAANYTTGDSIHIHSNGTQLSFNDYDAGNSKITVLIQDSNGVTATKQFSMRILKSQDLALPAPAKDDNIISGFSGFVSTTNTDNTDYSSPDNHSFYFAPDNSSITVVMNTTGSNTAASAFMSCSGTPTSSNSCPPFQNHGIMSTYFTLEKYDDGTWTYPLGFTFALIKSYVPGTTYTSTEYATGGGDAGLGYGGSGGSYTGIKAGDSFAVEFDLLNDGQKDDPDGDHITINAHADINNYDGTYTSGNFNHNNTYEAYGNNVHDYFTDNHDTIKAYDGHNAGDLAYYDYNEYALYYNDRCTTSGQTGTGCYFDTTKEIIPNTYTGGDKLGIRIEAVSGCSYNTSTAKWSCNKATGVNNYVCVQVWRYTKTQLNASSALNTAMKDSTVNYTYNYLTNGTAYGTIGSPTLKNCYPDNTTSKNYLDYVRFGFTSSSFFKYVSSDPNYLPHYIRITEFASSIWQY